MQARGVGNTVWGLGIKVCRVFDCLNPRVRDITFWTIRIFLMGGSDYKTPPQTTPALNKPGGP